MTAQDVDVLVIGAGLAGIGAAWHLQHERPGTSFAILEARDAIGGTWDLFRFPGVRSDSDMHTLSLPYQPWRGTESRADGASIRDYLRETASRIRDRHPDPVRAQGDSGRVVVRRGTVDARRARRWTPETWTCAFLYGCTGYYDYAAGYTPHLAGVEDYRGQVVHPQFWPDDLDVRGRRVAVIGSGATAVTLVPALADAGAEVTMVQRSPSWVAGVSQQDHTAARLRRWLPGPAGRLGDAHPERRGEHRPVRDLPPRPSGGRRIPASAVCVGSSARRRSPSTSRRATAPGRSASASPRATTSSTRSPTGAPSSSRTGSPGSFREGLELGSGRVVEADVVVTATGLNLLALGGVDLVVDGRRGGSRRDVRLPGRDAERCAEPRRLPRVRQRVVDAAGRGDPRVRVPGAGLPRRARRGVRHAGRPGRYASASGAGAHLGVRAAGPGRVPQAGRPGRVDDPAELVRRPPRRAARSGRAGHDLRRPSSS